MNYDLWLLTRGRLCGRGNHRCLRHAPQPGACWERSVGVRPRGEGSGGGGEDSEAAASVGAQGQGELGLADPRQSPGGQQQLQYNNYYNRRIHIYNTSIYKTTQYFSTSSFVKVHKYFSCACRADYLFFLLMMATNMPQICHQYISNMSPIRHQYVTNTPPICHQYGTNMSPIRHQYVTNTPPICHQYATNTLAICH